MGKGARIRERHRQEALAGPPPERPVVQRDKKETRRLRKESARMHRVARQAYARSKTETARPSIANLMEHRAKWARWRNGRPRGRTTTMARRNDPRTFVTKNNEPPKGSARAWHRAANIPGAVFRTLSGKRWVDEDLVKETREEAN